MNTLAKAVVRQTSARGLTNNRAINRIGLGVGLHRRFHIPQVRYLGITNAQLLLLTSLRRDEHFTKTCHSGL